MQSKMVLNVSLLLFAVLLSISLAAPIESRDLAEWEDFKTTYSKTYPNEDEENKRLGIYMANKKIIEEHNKRYEKGEVTFKMKANQFSDLTKDEFKHGILLSPERPHRIVSPTKGHLVQRSHPDEMHGIVGDDSLDSQGQEQKASQYLLEQLDFEVILIDDKTARVRSTAHRTPIRNFIKKPEMLRNSSVHFQPSLVSVVIGLIVCIAMML